MSERPTADRAEDVCPKCWNTGTINPPGGAPTFTWCDCAYGLSMWRWHDGEMPETDPRAAATKAGGIPDAAH